MEGQRNLQSDYFQSQGYFAKPRRLFRKAEVTNGRQEIDYKIDLGVRHRLMAVDHQRQPLLHGEGLAGTHADAAQVPSELRRGRYKRRLPAPR